MLQPASFSKPTPGAESTLFGWLELPPCDSLLSLAVKPATPSLEWSFPLAGGAKDGSAVRSDITAWVVDKI